MQITILAQHYMDWLKIIGSKNKQLFSPNFTQQEINRLHDKKYKLTEFDIYKYITAHDTIKE